MPRQITDKISVNGWANVGTILKAAGYSGPAIVKSLTVVNNSATAAYLHFTSNGSTNPTTAADGLLISTAGPSTAYSEFGCDLSTTWINTGSALDITFCAIGER